MTCSHVKRTTRQFAEPGGTFRKTLTTTQCACDEPGPAATHTLDNMSGWTASA